MNVHDSSLYKYGTPPHTPRSMTNFLLSIYGNRPLVGCEVGVLEAANSASILTLLNMERLYLVDPYLPYGNRSKSDMDECRILAHNHLSQWNNISWIESTSENASTRISDNTLDFIYLDGPHTLENTMNDIRCWYSKVKVGGYIDGHDYQHIEGGYEIVEAVSNMCREYGLEDKGYNYYQKYASPGTPQCDWWARII